MGRQNENNDDEDDRRGLRVLNAQKDMRVASKASGGARALAGVEKLAVSA